MGGQATATMDRTAAATTIGTWTDTMVEDSLTEVTETARHRVMGRQVVDQHGNVTEDQTIECPILDYLQDRHHQPILCLPAVRLDMMAVTTTEAEDAIDHVMTESHIPYRPEVVEGMV